MHIDKTILDSAAGKVVQWIYRMFAYFGNNPISRVDATGQAWLAAAVGSAIAGVYTAINTEGTIEQKILSGALTGAIAAGSTFVGASIKTGDLSPLATTFANYGITLAVGTPAEFTAVSVQTAINSSSVAAKTSSKSASSNRNRPRNYVALRV